MAAASETGDPVPHHGCDDFNHGEHYYLYPDTAGIHP